MIHSDLVKHKKNLFAYKSHEARQSLNLRRAAYPGGPSRVIVEGEWYRDMGKCPVAKTTLVKRDKHHSFNLSARFMFLEDCYRRPVALWPFDPLHRLESEDPKTKWFHVIDRNQEEIQDA